MRHWQEKNAGLAPLSTKTIPYNLIESGLTIVLMQIACNQLVPAASEVSDLEKVKNLPYELHEEIHFGKSIEVIDKLLKQIGLVSINGADVSLDEISLKTTGNVTMAVYSNKSYRLEIECQPKT